ncbi:hypothetical protein ABT160_34000 [Streptomyces sp. NPDC001941]|uniref:YncE family protein n=1 Tax=Streptomyces sp. NPDC001941 TaxID=3154659 RepID=UPI003317BBBD
MRPAGPSRRLVLGALGAGALAACTRAPQRPAATPEPLPSSTPAAPGTGRPAPSTTLLVADFGSDTVTFVDPDPDRGPLGSVRVGRAPYGLVVDEDGGAWVATAEGVALVDTRARKRLALVPYRTPRDRLGPVTGGEYRGGGMGIALAPDGRQVYVGVNVPDGNGVLEVVDTSARAVVRTVAVGRRPFDVDVSRDGSEVYAVDHDSFDVTVVPVRGAGAFRPRRIEVAPYGTEGGLGSWLKPHYAAVRPTDGRLLLPFEGERLAVVDPRTGRVAIERMTANTHQHGVTITRDGTLLVVGTGPIDPSVDDGPSLTVRRPDGSERVFPLQGPHEDVAVSRDGRMAYVTGGFTRDGYWDGITVVELSTGRSRRLAAGKRPLGIAVL